MRLRHFLLLTTTALAMTGCVHDRPVELRRWLRASASETYQRPEPADRAQLAAAFAAALRNGDASGWQALHYETRHEDGHLAVREQAPATRGWGAYAFRDAGGRALLVQAPHSESDRDTGDIGAGVYLLTHARALGLNTAHRTLPDADQAGAADTPFLLMADEALRADPSTVIVQIHGFGPDTANRYGIPLDGAVASNATRTPDDALRATVRCMREAGFDARAFPDEAPYPGGTRNAIGRLVADSGRGRFMHLELGAQLRARLATDARALESFAACL